MTWIKICGITNLEDALVAVEAGADALGFVFYEKSPRNMTPQAVRQIAQRLPRQVERIGVFVNTQDREMDFVVAEADLTGWQLHKNLNGTPLEKSLCNG